MSRPRVLVDALSLGPGGGGSRSYVTNLLAELARDDRGFDLTVLAQPGALRGMDVSGVTVAELRLPVRGRVLWRVLYEEALLPLRARGFDLLYCVADIAPPFATTPTVVLLRNLNIYDRRWYDDRRTRTLERLARWGVPRARRILFPSRAAAELISARIPVPAERVRVVPYGISLDAFQDAPAADEGHPYLFLAAAPERHKNVAVLVECLPLLQDGKLEVWIAGRSLLDPAHQQELERRAAELGVADRLRFLGPVPYRELLRYYRGAVAFVFPSFIETFGHPLLEAMASGTPVVASDIPTFREIAGDAALYFPPTDPAALAAAIASLENDRAATARRVESGRRRAAELSWRRCVDGLCEAFREVLAEGRR
jgi:glycosyltransferase involved in cell wall biosynthesis